jgi:2-alkenal reductase
MEKDKFALTVGLGCVVLILVLAIVVIPLFVVPLQVRQITSGRVPVTEASETEEVGEPAPTFSLPTPNPNLQPGSAAQVFTALYEQLNPGVVSIRVYVEREGLTGRGAGSGFVLDDEGHIVTNNHVVADAERVTVIFHSGIEADAEIVGTDPDSDLAVIQVDAAPEGTHALPLGDSARVRVGEWVIAIGNPFGLGGSMTLGIVSAVGRTIPSGATPFDIPQAIQTDAAINPGNSGGPLLNLQGEVVGVNAQIATSGVQANAGVGFAIPSEVVRRVAPALITSGSYQWPWLGVRGTSVNQAIAEANNLETQQGAYIDVVEPGGPAEEAGLQGSSGTRRVSGFDGPIAIGGDVVIEADGEPVSDFSDLLIAVTSREPDDSIVLTIIRGGRRQQVTVTLVARPADLRQ